MNCPWPKIQHMEKPCERHVDIQCSKLCHIFVSTNSTSCKKTDISVFNVNAWSIYRTLATGIHCRLIDWLNGFFFRNDVEVNYIKAPRLIHSVPDVSDRRSWRCGCHARLCNLHDVTTRPVCKRRFSAFPIDKMSSVENLDHYGVFFAHPATGCGINAKDPSGLNSDRRIPHSRCCENPSRAKSPRGILAPPHSGIHRSESSPSRSVAIKLVDGPLLQSQ